MRGQHRTLAVIAVTVLVSALPVSAAENETFGIAPHPTAVEGVERRTFEVPLETGTTFRDRLRVYNRTNQEVTLLLYAVDARTTDDDQISIGFRDSNPEGVGSWIDLSRSSVTLGVRESVQIPFSIRVETDAPTPDLGAIVAENTTRRGSGQDLAQRLYLLVRTAPPGTVVAAERVPRGLRSPWWWVGFAALLVAAYLVWRRTRRTTRDMVVEPSDPEASDAPPEPAGAPRPTLLRLGERPSDAASPEDTDSHAPRRPVEPAAADSPPTPADEPRPQRPQRRPRPVQRPAPRPRRPQPKRRENDELNYIPLDDL